MQYREKLAGSMRALMQNVLGILKCFGLGHFSTVFDLFYLMNWFSEYLQKSSFYVSFLTLMLYCGIFGGSFFFILQRKFFESSGWGFMQFYVYFTLFFHFKLTVSDVLTLCSFFLFFGFFWLSVLLHVALPMPVDSRGTFVIL